MHGLLGIADVPGELKQPLGIEGHLVGKITPAGCRALQGHHQDDQKHGDHGEVHGCHFPQLEAGAGAGLAPRGLHAGQDGTHAPGFALYALALLGKPGK